MRKGFLGLVGLLLLPAFASAQSSQLPNDARLALEQAAAAGVEAQRVLGLYPVTPPPPALPAAIPVGGDVQAALDAGGIVVLEAGAVYEGPGLRITKSGTTLLGNGATIRSTSGPALYSLPNVDDVYASGLFLASPYTSVVQIGDASATTQGALELVPERIKLVGLSVPTHRNRRAFAIHGAHVEMLGCYAADTYYVDGGFDSQAIWIHNTPGPVLVDGGEFSAGSEVVMVGGDSIKIPGLHASGLTFRNLKLWRPLSWRMDGIKRGVKNIFELKDGDGVRVENVVMDGSWSDAQISFAIVLTPRQGGGIRNVTFDRVTVLNVGGGLNILGDNSVAPYAPFKTTGIKVIDSNFAISKTEFGGHGILAMLTGGPGTLEISGTRFVGDNYYGGIVSVADQKVVESIRLLSNQLMAPYYTSVVLPIGTPGTNAIDTWVLDYAVEGNRIANSSSATRAKFPNNTFVTPAEF
jgi:hypothetical protein